MGCVSGRVGRWRVLHTGRLWGAPPASGYVARHDWCTMWATSTRGRDLCAPSPMQVPEAAALPGQGVWESGRLSEVGGGRLGAGVACRRCDDGDPVEAVQA